MTPVEALQEVFNQDMLAAERHQPLFLTRTRPLEAEAVGAEPQLAAQTAEKTEGLGSPSPLTRNVMKPSALTAGRLTLAGGLFKKKKVSTTIEPQFTLVLTPTQPQTFISVGGEEKKREKASSTDSDTEYEVLTCRPPCRLSVCR